MSTPGPRLAHIFKRYGRRSFTGTVAAAATFVDVSLGGPGTDEAWLVERIVHRGVGITNVRWYTEEAGNDLLEVESTTLAANVADESSPIYVAPGEEFVVRVTAPAATVVTGRIQYRILRED